MTKIARRPEWIKLTPLHTETIEKMTRLMRGLHLHTVCESAHCPNQSECFSMGTATFMILGDICTRNCTFCAIKKGRPEALDANEPDHVLEAVKKLNLRYAVITSVTRDDLEDGGAEQFSRVIKLIRAYDPHIPVEVLIPDLQGSAEALKTVIDAQPSVLNHNVETVPRLYTEVRPKASYERSVGLLQRAKSSDPRLYTKSGIMVGLGETLDEIVSVMKDLRSVGCNFLTIGQYLQPSLKHHAVIRYVTPEEFKEYEEVGKTLGFTAVVSGPLVRSSFHAAETFFTP